MGKIVTNVKFKGVVLLLILFFVSQIFAAPCGDVNSNGRIGIIDALMTAQYYVGLNPVGFDSGAADVNGDGKITVIDALQIAQYYVGVITSLPGCNPAPTPKTPEGMVYVEGGTFQMGSIDPGGDADEAPVHSVTLSSFYIGITEVTNTEYCKFLNAYGSNKAIGGEYNGATMIVENKWGVKKNGAVWEPQAGYENHPAVPLSWVGANEYCKWLGNGFRLPTEAEWEYAASGGQKATSTLYAGSNNIDEVAWYEKNRKEGTAGPMPVKQKAPNELGLYDMSGNVWEACADWYNEDFYSQSVNSTNPLCDTGEKKLKVWRGGSWHQVSASSRIYDRGWRIPGGYLTVFGVRVVASAP